RPNSVQANQRPLVNLIHVIFVSQQGENVRTKLFKNVWFGCACDRRAAIEPPTKADSKEHNCAGEEQQAKSRGLEEFLETSLLSFTAQKALEPGQGWSA